jgi:hypothetical protein
MKNLLLFIAALILLVPNSTGCQKNESPRAARDFKVPQDGKQNDPEGVEFAGELVGKPEEVAQAAQPGPADADKAVKGHKNAPLARKIRYAGTIQLITENFAAAEIAVKKLVKDAEGYIANSDLKAAPGSMRTGFWKVRIPVKEFDSFREAVIKLGEVEKNSTDSQDLTEEYYDLENNIKNRQAEEEALRKLMDKASATMENFLSIRRELNQVREDIDRKQGRLKLLANLTDMTTVSLTIREKQKYVPDQPPAEAESPTFGTRLGKTLNDSAGVLVSFIQALAVFVTALVPWSPLFLAVAIPAWIYLQRQRHAPAPRSAADPDNPPPPAARVS